MMKKILLGSAFVILIAACGTNDNKNEVENYPTYDTAKTTDHINDSTSSQDMQSEGDLRHNIDRESE